MLVERSHLTFGEEVGAHLLSQFEKASLPDLALERLRLRVCSLFIQ